MFTYENDLAKNGFSYIAGVDEAGRGPLAGPVVAAAVILPDVPIHGINDSKKLTARQRESVFKDILLHATVGIGIVHHTIIDSINILEASKKAMALAVKDLVIAPDFLLIDGRDKISLPIPQQAVVHGDQRCLSVAAASIVAKVSRDHLMQQMGQHFPLYGFENHVGYGTWRHREALATYGPCPEHRSSFRWKAPTHGNTRHSKIAG